MRRGGWGGGGRGGGCVGVGGRGEIRRVGKGKKGKGEPEYLIPNFQPRCKKNKKLIFFSLFFLFFFKYAPTLPSQSPFSRGEDIPGGDGCWVEFDLRC